MIRDATPADFAAIVRINAEWEHFLSPLSPSRLEFLHGQAAHHWVACTGDKVEAACRQRKQGRLAAGGIVVSMFVYRLGASFAPLLITIAAAWAVTLGPLSLGGGEKDIFLVLPFAIWSILFAVSSVVLWWRGMALARASKLAALLSLVLLALCLALAVLVWRKP